MRVLQVGCGKMGEYTLRALRNCPYVTSLCVCDPKFKTAHECDGVLYIPNLQAISSSFCDCAFILTPAGTHCRVLEELLGAGIRHIFVEKPAVMNMAEYERIQKIRGDAQIVTGYILRQSGASPVLHELFASLRKDGFLLTDCHVQYQKNLPANAELRAKTDIGVFEEIVHVWDYLFNFLGFRQAACRLCASRLLADPLRTDRTIYASLDYVLRFPYGEVPLSVFSSFREEEKKRQFTFCFQNARRENREIRLAFDRPDNTDGLTVTDEAGHILTDESYPALDKLTRQVDAVFTYFTTGNAQSLCLLDESMSILTRMHEVGIDSLA